MYVIETNSCCSVLEIGNLNEHCTRENLIEQIKDTAYDFFGEVEDLNEIPQIYIAMTTLEQTEAARCLKEWGFRPKKVQGRHRNRWGANNKYLTFWMRTTQFSEIKKWIREEKKHVLRNG